MTDRELLASLRSQLGNMAAQIDAQLAGGTPVVPPYVPPAQPPATTPSTGVYDEGVLVAKGRPDPVMLPSGRIKCYPLPSDGTASGTIASGEQSGSPQPRKMEICISKTKGLIDPASPNYAWSDKQISAVFLNRPVLVGAAGRGQMELNGSNAYNMFKYLWAPASEGQWFVNVRYEYDMSEGPKPLYFEWNNGPYQ